ncbi:hypothetical protein DID88_009609 [Monilinia fructigena]|uniref:Cytochrome b-c1 complex subunit 2, mitochondrial n=1 Tax=Monilinia fructigena TaxID=38457 RepID=A0A395IMR6_9HELO|nr:hypothetical protein DID88_009609 [Monilinia fructigena]
MFAGIKVASRDVAGATTKLAVVAKAGTRYQTAPGLTSGLERFAFKNTLKRSALRICRESELLGAQLNAYHTREALVVEAKFLREDLPYFTELLGEVVSATKYTPHEYTKKSSTRSSWVKRNSLEIFIEVVGEFFTGTHSGQGLSGPGATKYYGGEERIAHDSGNSFVLAFPGSSSFTAGGSYKPEFSAASAFPGASATATNFAYSDAGLLALQFNGSASAVRSAAIEAVKALKAIAEGSISQEDFTKAVANAKYNALEEGQNVEAGLVLTGSGLVHGGKAFQIDEVGKSVESVSIEKLKSAAEAILEGKATVSAVGDLYVLPYAEELGLSVRDDNRTGVGILKSRELGSFLQFFPRSTEPKVNRHGSNLSSITSSRFTYLSSYYNAFAWKASGLTYNKYLSVAARTVRRSLKDDKRLAAERRGEMELRFAKWTNGKQGEVKNVAEANAASIADAASSS